MIFEISESKFEVTGLGLYTPLVRSFEIMDQSDNSMVALIGSTFEVCPETALDTAPIFDRKSRPYHII